MNLTGIPAKFPIPWGSSAGANYINTIPVPSQIGTNPGYASLTDGFPPSNSQPGGIPPRIKDWNGILNEVTAWLQWDQAGGQITYDATFQTSIGGYPKGAMVSSTAGGGAHWLSTADANTTNPEAGGAGWVPVFMGESGYAADTGTVNAVALTLAAGTFALQSGTIIGGLIAHTNTGATTLTVGGASYAVTQGGVALSGGELTQNWAALFLIVGTNAQLLSSGAGPVNVGAATAPTHAVQLQQLSAIVPSGAVMPYAMNTPPAGWLEANGAAISRTTYANLFAAIGTIYGSGDGSTTFNLPDLRGYFVRGWDDGRGVDSGRAFGSAQADVIAPHTQTISVIAGSNLNTGSYGPGSDASATGSVVTQTGGETRPKNIALYYCIKT